MCLVWFKQQFSSSSSSSSSASDSVDRREREQRAENRTEHICEEIQLNWAELKGAETQTEARERESTSVNRTEANLVNRQSSLSSSPPPPPPVVASSYQHRFIFFSLPSVPAKAQQNRELDRKSRSTVKECDWDLLPASWLTGWFACLSAHQLVAAADNNFFISL